MFSQNKITEKWLPIKGYEILYEVSNLGNIRNAKTKKELKPFDRNGKGYLTVHLVSMHLGVRFKNKLVHQLVAESFLGDKPDNYVVHHIDGDKKNNEVKNLLYCTQSQNRKFDFIDGRQSLSGERNTMSKLSESDILEIIFLKDNCKLSNSKIASIYSVGRALVTNIFNGQRWSHLTGIYYV